MGMSLNPSEHGKEHGRALIAVGMKTQILLATDLISIWYEVDSTGSDSLSDVLGELTREEAAEPGVYLWEGDIKWTSYDTFDGPSEPYYEAKDGTVKLVIDGTELRQLLEMEPKELDQGPEDDREQIQPGDFRYFEHKPEEGQQI